MMPDWDEYADYVDGPKAATNPALPNADELEVVALLKESDGQTFDGEVHLSSAEAAAIIAQIDRLTRERDEAWNTGYASRDAVVDACRNRAEAAEAEVKRLREANEALMMERTSLIETKRGQIEMLLSTIDRCRIDAFVATAKAEASAVEMDRLLGLIDQHGSAKLIRLSGGTSNG